MVGAQLWAAAVRAQTPPMQATLGVLMVAGVAVRLPRVDLTLRVAPGPLAW